MMVFIDDDVPDGVTEYWYKKGAEEAANYFKWRDRFEELCFKLEQKRCIHWLSKDSKKAWDELKKLIPKGEREKFIHRGFRH